MAYLRLYFESDTVITLSGLEDDSGSLVTDAVCTGSLIDAAGRTRCTYSLVEEDTPGTYTGTIAADLPLPPLEIDERLTHRIVATSGVSTHTFTNDALVVPG